MTDERTGADTAPETTDPAPETAVTAPARRGGFVSGFAGGLIGGLLVSALALAAAGALWPQMRTRLLGFDPEQLQSRTASMGRTLALMQGVLASHGQDEESGGLAQRVGALEQRLANPAADPRLAPLAQSVEEARAETNKLQNDVAALRDAIPPAGTILRLAERADAAEKVAKEIASRHAQTQALLLVVGQLRDAVDRGDPYDMELQAARRVAGADLTPLLDGLAATAATGLPRRATLLDSFAVLAPAIFNAGLAPENGDLWHRALHKLAGMITIRRIDGIGTDTAAVLARAERDVHANALEKAVRDLEPLQGAPAAVAAPWLRDAKARLAADKTLSELAAAAIAKTAQPGG